MSLFITDEPIQASWKHCVADHFVSYTIMPPRVALPSILRCRVRGDGVGGNDLQHDWLQHDGAQCMTPLVE